MTDQSNDAFRGAHYEGADFSGATFRECDMTGVRIVGSEIVDFQLSGNSGVIGKVVVNDVDVSDFVAAELDRRFPERVQMRAVRSADDHRAMWQTIEALWSETTSRAERLAEPGLYERVGDEWSFVETLRHLVFATDVWVSRMVLGESMPYHPLGIPPTDYPTDQLAAIGIDLDAPVSYTAVKEVRAGRMALMRRTLDALTDSDLEQTRTAAPAPVWDEETLEVGSCLRVVMREECEHHRYAVRDLALLESRA